MPTCIHGWGSDGINQSGCPHCAEMGRQQDKDEIVRLRAEVERLKDDRAAVLRDVLDVIPQDICTHDGCEESTCPLTRVNVAISGLLEKK